MDTPSHATGTGIALHARHNPLAWLLYFTKLTVTVDGNAQRLSWGHHVVSLEPGDHEVTISFNYMGSQRGENSASVPVRAGALTTVKYRMPSWMFAKGRIDVGA